MKLRGLNEIAVGIINHIHDKLPEIDTKEGSFIRDVFVNPVSAKIAELYQEAQLVELGQSVLTATGEDLDKLGMNYFIKRKFATHSTGKVRFYFKEKPSTPINIVKGTVIYTQSTISREEKYFETTEAHEIMPNSPSTYFLDATTGLYYVDISAQSSIAGLNYNIGPNEISRVSDGIHDNILSVTNPFGFSGGTDQEDDSSLALRISLAVTGSNIGTKDGYTSFILKQEGVVDAKVIGPEDILMKRDEEKYNGLKGGMVDIYVRAERHEEIEQPFVLGVDVYEDILLPKQPLTKIISVKKADPLIDIEDIEPYINGSDYYVEQGVSAIADKFYTEKEWIFDAPGMSPADMDLSNELKSVNYLKNYTNDLDWAYLSNYYTGGPFTRYKLRNTIEDVYKIVHNDTGRIFVKKNDRLYERFYQNETIQTENGTNKYYFDKQWNSAAPDMSNEDALINERLASATYLGNYPDNVDWSEMVLTAQSGEYYFNAYSLSSDPSHIIYKIVSPTSRTFVKYGDEIYERIYLGIEKGTVLTEDKYYDDKEFSLSPTALNIDFNVLQNYPDNFDWVRLEDKYPFFKSFRLNDDTTNTIYKFMTQSGRSFVKSGGKFYERTYHDVLVENGTNEFYNDIEWDTNATYTGEDLTLNTELQRVKTTGYLKNYPTDINWSQITANYPQAGETYFSTFGLVGDSTQTIYRLETPDLRIFVMQGDKLYERVYNNLPIQTENGTGEFYTDEEWIIDDPSYVGEDLQINSNLKSNTLLNNYPPTIDWSKLEQAYRNYYFNNLVYKIESPDSKFYVKKNGRIYIREYVVPHFKIVKDYGNYGFSVEAKDSIRWMNQSLLDFEEGDTIVVKYNYNEIISELQKNIDEKRVLTADVLIKQAKKVGLDVRIEVAIYPQYDPTEVKNSIINTISSYINNLKQLGSSIDTSDLVSIVRMTSGVDLVYLNTVTLLRSPIRGEINEVQSTVTNHYTDQIFKTSGSNEYFEIDNIVVTILNEDDI